MPSGTDIELQVAFSANEEGPWNFVGPDGTSGTKFTTSSGQSVHGSPSSRYCRYKSYLTGDGTTVTTWTFTHDSNGNMTPSQTVPTRTLTSGMRTTNSNPWS